MKEAAAFCNTKRGYDEAMEFFENRKKGTVGLEDGKKRAEYDARKQDHRKQYNRQ